MSKRKRSWPAKASHVVLYHGCLRSDARKLIGPGAAIVHNVGRPDLDFGVGFYMTTSRRQAKAWARQKRANLAPASRGTKGARGVVVWIRVDRSSLASLASLVFVRGDYGHHEYWAFIQHCRSGASRALGHCRTGPQTMYDLVCGPVSAFWTQRVAMPDSDQYSFHTPTGVNALNSVISLGKRGRDYGMIRA